MALATANIRRPFEFSAWDTFQKQPLAHPGKLYDRTDNDGHSGVPKGGPAPYGRMLVRGIANGDFDLTEKYYTNYDSVSLPDIAGAHLVDSVSGDNYAAAGLALPLDTAGLLMPAGVGIWTEFRGGGWSPRLDQPFGLGDCYYQPETCGQVGMCIEGNIWCYTETDMNIGDDIFFRTTVTSTTDGLQLLGAFSNVGGGDFQPFNDGTVLRPGPKGGAFVLNLNTRKG